MFVVRRFENTFVIQTGVDSPKSTEIVSEAHSAACLYVGVRPKQVAAHTSCGVRGDVEPFVDAFGCCRLCIRLYGKCEHCDEYDVIQSLCHNKYNLMNNGDAKIENLSI